MLLEQLIKSENTYGLFDLWEAYRQQLTNYVLDCIESYNIKEYLKAAKRLRMDSAYKTRDILSAEKKSVLAIWGAGSSGDIDLQELSRYFKLVLIDRDLSGLELAKQRYGLNDEDCILVDLGFWDVRLEDYQLFEAMLIDGASASDIARFLQCIVDDMPFIDYRDIPQFDYSVAVGVASQLNSRFAALLKVYEEHEGKYNREEILLINNKLNTLNKEATERLVMAMRQTTKKLAIIGYEVTVYGKEEIATMEERLEELKHSLLEENSHRQPGDANGGCVQVAGSKELHNILNQLVEENKLYQFSKNYMIWQFLEEKSYIMSIRAFLELGLEV